MSPQEEDKRETLRTAVPCGGILVIEIEEECADATLPVHKSSVSSIQLDPFLG
jgi:hypothetical protein